MTPTREALAAELREQSLQIDAVARELLGFQRNLEEARAHKETIALAYIRKGVEGKNEGERKAWLASTLEADQNWITANDDEKHWQYVVDDARLRLTHMERLFKISLAVLRTYGMDSREV